MSCGQSSVYVRRYKKGILTTTKLKRIKEEPSRDDVYLVKREGRKLILLTKAGA
jgi:hypothetical protein